MGAAGVISGHDKVASKIDHQTAARDLVFFNTRKLRLTSHLSVSIVSYMHQAVGAK